MNQGGHASARAAFRFVPAERCAMCGAGREAFRFLGRRLDRHQGLSVRRRTGASVSVVRCRTCGLVFPDPMPLPDSPASLYGVAPDSYWPPEYFAPPSPAVAAFFAETRSMLGARKRPTALDVGAGIGKGVLALRDAGFDAVGLEPSPTFRALALERMGLGEADVLLGAIEDASFPEAGFDFVNFGAVLEHLAQPREALARAVTWLRPGGVIHVEVPHADWLQSRGLNLFYRLSGQGFVTNTSPMHPPFHLYEFTLASIRAAASSLGCSVARSEVWVADVFGPRRIAGVLRAVMRRTGTGMQLAAWLRKP